MNKYLYLLATLCLVIASCSDDDTKDTPPVPTPTPFWESSHVAFAGLKGTVSRLVAQTYALPGENGETPEGEESATILDMRFNAAGLMTFYNSTGIEPSTRGSVWQTMAYYAYKYDDQGRMMQATVTPVGDEPMVYNLRYGEHNRYVPLIFPLGAMDFFLVKGLQSITSADETISYSFDGDKASYKEESWMGDTETEYLYEGEQPYPTKKRVTTSRDGEVQSEETTSYTYDADGRLVATDTRTTESGIETTRSIVRYASGEYLLPVSRKTDMGNFMMDWNYAYDGEGRLQRLGYVENAGSEEEATAHEEYVYLSVDSHGNWTDSKQLQSSLVDWSHVDGWVGVRREITY